MKAKLKYEDEYDKIAIFERAGSNSYIEAALNKENDTILITFLLRVDGDFMPIVSRSTKKGDTRVTVSTVAAEAVALMKKEIELWEHS